MPDVTQIGKRIPIIMLNIEKLNLTDYYVTHHHIITTVQKMSQKENMMKKYMFFRKLNSSEKLHIPPSLTSNIL